MSSGVRPAGVPVQTVRPRSSMKQRSATPAELLQRLVDDEDRRARALQLVDRRPDLLAHDRRQALGRLVEDQQPRVGHQRPADRQHLLLAARERAGGLGAPLARGAGTASRRAPASSAPGRAAAVRFSSTVSGAKQRRPSGTRPMPSRAMRWMAQAAGRLAGEADRAVARAQQRADGADRRGLAHAVAAHQRHHLALGRPRGRRRTAPGWRRRRR